jgi:hypothetical protein
MMGALRVTLGLVAAGLVVASCERPGPAASSPAPVADPRSPPTAVASGPAASPRAPLNDVQLECRSSQMLEIGQLNGGFGARCPAGSTMPEALDIFDYGSSVGFIKASREALAMTFLCICKDGSCSKADAELAVNNASKVMVDESGKPERDGVLQITNDLTSSPCEELALGVAIFKDGLACGYSSALRSILIRQQMEKSYKEMVPGGDDLQATARADACFALLASPSR